jgi:Lsr2
LVQTLLIDDIDGRAAEGTVHFGLDSTDYEIDLNAEHAQQRPARRARSRRRSPHHIGQRLLRPASSTRMARPFCGGQFVAIGSDT